MEKEEVKKRAEQYHGGSATEKEKCMFDAWYMDHQERPVDLTDDKIDAAELELFQKLPGNIISGNFQRGMLLAAAAIGVIMVSLLVEVVFHKHDLVVRNSTHDIAPGGNKAILSLANGQVIDLANAASGSISVQQGTRVVKTLPGQLVYEDNGDQAQPGKNTITTPKGGTWQVRLPDGTRVWLNNSSSLTYPASFRGNKRRAVTLTGEAYFEVAKDKLHPFIVSCPGQEVEVLGTHFDINAFPDEQVIRTTLLEGRVKVIVAGKKLTRELLPEMQAQLSQNNLGVTHVNAEEIVAWKNGYFRFNNTPIEQVMREMGRWYDIDVRYEGPLPTEKFNGRISRSKNISKVLSALEATKTVHFKVEGRRVTVMK